MIILARWCIENLVCFVLYTIISNSHIWHIIAVALGCTSVTWGGNKAWPKVKWARIDSTWGWTSVNKGEQAQTGGTWGQMSVNKHHPTNTNPHCQLLCHSSYYPWPSRATLSESTSPVSSTSPQTSTGFKIVLYNSSLSLLIVHLPSQPNGSSQLHPLPTHCFHSYSIVPLDYLLPHMLDLDLR